VDQFFHSVAHGHQFCFWAMSVGRKVPASAYVAASNQAHSCCPIRHIVAPFRDLLAVSTVTSANSRLEAFHDLGDNPYPLDVGWRWDFVQYSQYQIGRKHLGKRET
jgi:hypothetical protein